MDTKTTIEDIKNCKGKRKISLLTAYDYSLAYILDKAGIDIILVGDSLANVALGLESTKEVGMTEMIYHAQAVRRAVKKALLVGDMPYEAGQKDAAFAQESARRFIQEAGCEAIKLEWFEGALAAAAAIINSGIPVMGHIGLTPQTADKLGGFKVQGKDAAGARRIIEEAIALEDIGCFSILLECVPEKLAQIITKKLNIPTIGIGAGAFCDGQAMVTQDMLGLFPRYTPKFVKKYLDLEALITIALEDYQKDIQTGKFPSFEHSFSMNPEELKKLTA